MKSINRVLSIAFALTIILVGCKNKGEEDAASKPLAAFLPAETFLYFSMSPKELSTKLEHDNLSKLNGYKMLIGLADEEEDGMGTLIDEAIKDPGSLGLDPDERILIFVAEEFEDGYGGAVMKIKDEAKWNDFLKKIDAPELEEDEESGIKYIKVANDGYYATNGKVAMILMGDSERIGDEGKEIVIRLFEQSEDESLMGKGTFDEAMGLDDDMVFMMKLPEAMTDDFKDLMEGGISGDEEEVLACMMDWNNMDLSQFAYFYTLNFEMGEIVLDMKYDWDEMSSMTRMGDMLVPINTAAMNTINTDEAIFSYAMAFDPDYIISVMEECGVMDMADEELAAAGLSAEEIAGWFGGNIYMQISGMEEMDYREEDYWAYDDQSGKAPIMTNKEMLPVFMLNMDLRDAKGMTEFVELLELGATFSEEFSLTNNGNYWTLSPVTAFDMYFGASEDQFYFGNNEAQIAAYVNGTYDAGDQNMLANMNGQMAYMHFNMNLDPAIASMITEAAASEDPFGVAGMAIEFLSMFDYMEAKTGKDGGKFVIKMQDDSHYALYMLLEMADDASPI